MGGFLGIGGSSAKTDRATALKGFTQLSNVFNFALPFGESTSKTGAATTKEGTDALSSSLNYFQKLLSGNRSTIQQAIAPETNAVLAGADAQKRQQFASGTARGGGTAGTRAGIDTSTRAQIDNAIFGVRPAAASESAKIGGQLSAVGLGQTNAALEALGLGERSAEATTELATKSRELSAKLNAQAVSNVTAFIDQALTAAFMA